MQTKKEITFLGFSLLKIVTDQNKNVCQVNILGLCFKRCECNEVGGSSLSSNQNHTDINLKIEKKLNVLERKLNLTINNIVTTRKLGYELLYSNVFNLNSEHVEWLSDRSFSPGRWAVGYPCLFFIIKSLDIMKPKKILEIGLGQSTRLIGQYSAYFNDVNHTVIESEEAFIKFFKTKNAANFTKAKILNLPVTTEKEFNGIKNIRGYLGFSEKLRGCSFDFILVDGPLGSDMPHLSRIDLLEIIPSCLSTSFVIVFDDYNRTGESATFHHVLKTMSENKIEYCTGFYKGEKEIGVIVSPDLNYLTSL